MTQESPTLRTVVELIERMVEELEGTAAAQWENTTAHDYLEALGAWLTDCAGYYRNNFDQGIPDNTWRVISDALEAARTYE